MKRLAIALLVAAFAIGTLGAQVARAQAYLLIDYVGFDYEDPNPVPATFGEPGSGYVGLGEVPGLFAPLTPDFANNEYTYYIHGLTQTNTQTFGSFIVVDYTPGRLDVFEDSKTSGTLHDYGSNPPSAVAPGTFTDGTLFISGSLTNFRFVFNTTNGSGSYEGDWEADSGSQIGNIAVGDRKGWTFAGATSNSLQIPQGYYHQIDGQVFLNNTPVRTQMKSWGGVKGLYR
jgi:hypothetical protein